MEKSGRRKEKIEKEEGEGQDGKRNMEWKEGRKEGNVERGKDLKERRRHGKRDRV